MVISGLAGRSFSRDFEVLEFSRRTPFCVDRSSSKGR